MTTAQARIHKVDSFAETLAAGRFIFTAEITPPASCNADDVLRMARPLKGVADAVNVTDGAGAHAHMSALAAAAILAKEGLEPILQLVCRDRNRIALQADLMGAAALGIRNLLILRGDNPEAGDQPDAKAVFDLDAVGLLQTARNLRDQQELPSGRKVSGAAEFLLGAADLPLEPSAQWKPEGLLAKIGAGARFVQTQFCMDAPLLRRYMKRLEQYRIPEQIRFIVGIAPLHSARSARWMRNHLYGTTIPDRLIERMENARDPLAEGRSIALELIREYSNMHGIAGVHIMAPGNGQNIPLLISEARKL
jgi:methylenetetrahydrofolate reductase (NADPH)